LILLVEVAFAWPTYHSQLSKSGNNIGPPCTIGAHNNFPRSVAGACPNRKQPPPPPHTKPTIDKYQWPDAFQYQWQFYFIPDLSVAPPYDVTMFCKLKIVLDV
jgi:hypothetical protein